MSYPTRAQCNEYRKRAHEGAYDIAYEQRPYVKRRRLNARLMHDFGITLEQRDALVESQGGGCAICGGPPRKEGWHVDHNHRTGKVRGILCGFCNTGLGLLQDKPILCARALAYLLGIKL